MFGSQGQGPGAQPDAQPGLDGARRDPLGAASHPGKQLIARCSKFRSTGRTDPTSVTKITLRSLARRINDLAEEIAELDALIEPLANDTAPALVELTGVGPEIASDGGDRQANSALWRIVLTRLLYDPRTRHYLERRTNEGPSRKEAIRCLKRYVAREVFNQLPRERLA